MIGALHGILALLLLLAHGLFLFRGLYMWRRGGKPTGLDRLARAFSQLLLPLTAITGFIAWSRRPLSFFPHPFLGFSPLAAILGVAVVRMALRNRKAFPWLLPVLNFLLLLAAAITGWLSA